MFVSKVLGNVDSVHLFMNLPVDGILKTVLICSLSPERQFQNESHNDAAHQGHGQAQEEAKYLGPALHSLVPVHLITPEAEGMDYPGVQTGSK